MMTQAKKDPFVGLYKKMLELSPSVCRKEFTFGGYSYGDVLALAAGLKKILDRRSGKKNICLCSANKAV
ncbi:MAG TPA: hypothetical protein PKL38_05765, partial [Smithella sp.]|nr:hypothetical protein [Smithella sp.]